MTKRKISDEDGALAVSTEVSRSIREVPPAHYQMKIDYFSMFSEGNFEKYESEDFEVGGYKWGLCLYPNGDEKRNGKGHLSLYLVIRDTDELPPGWVIRVQFKLFVFDEIQDKYLTVQDVDGKIRSFFAMKTECGYARFLTLDAFKDPSNGYLIGDSCEFGAEVFVVKCGGKGECLSMIKQPSNNTFTWKVDNFSSITSSCIFSEEFEVGERWWKLVLYPRGDLKSGGDGISLFLFAVDHGTLPVYQKLYTKYELRIKSQVCGCWEKEQGCGWFSKLANSRGFSGFKKLHELKDLANGYIMKDTLILQVEIMAMSELKKFP